MKRKVIAITGGIGAGKSQVAKILQSKGFQTVDCDNLSRQVAQQPQTLAAVQKLLGAEYVTNGQLNRTLIRQVIFKDSVLLSRYNKIFFDAILQLLDQIVQNSTETLFVEIPLLDAFEYDWYQIWLVTSSSQTRIDRVTARDNVDAQNVLDVMSQQKQTENYTAILHNDGSLQELEQQIDKLLQQL